MTTDPLDEAIYGYLDSLGCTLWGRAYDVSPYSPTRDEAAAFIRRTIHGVSDQLQARGKMVEVARVPLDPLTQGI